VVRCWNRGAARLRCHNAMGHSSTRGAAQVKSPRATVDNPPVIIIPIVVAAWFAVLLLAVALCRAAAQADRDTDTQWAPARSSERDLALIPTVAREASPPAGSISLRAHPLA
jgi:hypothetical protein